MKTVKLEWQEVSWISAEVQVPDDFSPNDYDIYNAVAHIQTAYCDGVERSQMTMIEEEADKRATGAEILKLDVYGEG